MVSVNIHPSYFETLLSLRRYRRSNLRGSVDWVAKKTTTQSMLFIRSKPNSQSFFRRLINSSRSNKCTSCSFFSKAPYSGGIALR